MNVFKKLGFVVAIAIPLSLVAQAQSSKLETEPKNTVTPAKAHEDRQSPSTSADEQGAIQSMSAKNKKVYSTLSEDDKKKVQEAAKNGKDPHNKMMDILKHDQKTESKKSKKSSAHSGFIWEDDATPAKKHSTKQSKPASQDL